jgi:hypothetical protein
MRRAFTFILLLSPLIIALSLAYYLVIYLPHRDAAQAAQITAVAAARTKAYRNCLSAAETDFLNAIRDECRKPNNHPPCPPLPTGTAKAILEDLDQSKVRCLAEAKAGLD